ncbi:MAG: glutamate--tRNA ligase [Anaerolineaceae bacterium]|nr:glutamate--tRNA ligase [Anaerolineaceae bacterium]
MSELNQPARVRFAPSPTGHMHLGSARTALYDYLIARQTGGQFILRIEDTDRKRFVEGAEEELMKGLRWLGLEWEEGTDVGGPYGPYRQSERKALYAKYARQLVENGHAYYCFCTPERLRKVREEQQSRKEDAHYDGTCRDISLAEADRRIEAGEKHVVRFKTPREGTTTVHDMRRGDITVENRKIDDYILVKSDGLALYHLAVIVDDHLMKVTHVVRGAEWLPTFPLHGMIYRAFGWQEPEFVHLSVFLKPSGKGKMSKREAGQLMKDGRSIFVKDFEDMGYLPEALVNWIALMGWSYDDHTEFFSMQDLIEKFSFEKVNPSPAAINFTKLDHFNGLHIRNLSVSDLAKRIKPFFVKAGYDPDDELLLNITPLLQERMRTLDEAVEKAAFFFREDVVPLPEDLVGKKLTANESADVLEEALKTIAGLTVFDVEALEQPLRNLVEELGLKAGQVFGILRVAVTGQKVSPPLFESMEIIGKEKSIERIMQGIALLREIDG